MDQFSDQIKKQLEIQGGFQLLFVVRKARRLGAVCLPLPHDVLQDGD